MVEYRVLVIWIDAADLISNNPFGCLMPSPSIKDFLVCVSDPPTNKESAYL